MMHFTKREIPIYGGFLLIIITDRVPFAKKYCSAFTYDEVFAHAIKSSYKGAKGINNI
jgi:hypothetical protein